MLHIDKKAIQHRAKDEFALWREYKRSHKGKQYEFKSKERQDKDSNEQAIVLKVHIYRTVLGRVDEQS